MSSRVTLHGWPDDERPQAWDLVCEVCGGSSRMNPQDRFVEQVRLFLAQHRHAGGAER